MSQKKFLVHYALAIGLCLSLAATANASDLAKVGRVHDDGRVEIFLGRFQPTLQTGRFSTLEVARTSVKISNGFLSIVRYANDGCTSEELVAMVHDGQGDLTAIRSPSREGDYVPVTDFPIAGLSAASKDIYVSLAHLYSCEDVSCPSGHVCRLVLSSPISCICVKLEIPPQEDLPWEQSDGYPYVDGCERRLDPFPSWWSLSSSVRPSYVTSG